MAITNQTTNIKYKKVIDLFPRQYVKEWMKKRKVLNFKKGELIISPGMLKDEVYLLKEGNAVIYHLHDDGKECILGLLNTGEFIDIIDIFTSNRESDVFAKALSEVEIIVLDKEEIIKIVESNSSLAMELLYYFTRRNRELIEILDQVAYEKVEERLIFILRKLADPLLQEQGWYPIPKSITHRDLAGMVASTRETVTTLINKLIQNGLLKQQDNKIWIQN